MSSARAITLLQVLIAIIGMLWKLKEGYPLLDLPDSSRLFESSQTGSRYLWLHVWLEVLTGISMTSMMDNWPWFSLHLFLYIGQMVPFMFILINESPSDKGMSTLLRYAELSHIPHDGSPPLTMERAIALLGCLSSLFGLSTAMPFVSVWILHRHRDGRHQSASELHQRHLLTALFWLSALTHVGAFSVAFIANWVPSMVGGPHAAEALKVVNSLVGVPDSKEVCVSSTGARQARLRQINEMTGTSSGFFMTVGLLFREFESKGRHITLGLLAWMFFVSLVAGPAAGGAAVLRLRDSMVRGESHDNSSLKAEDKESRA
jgi:hypothetical protein